MDDDCTGLARGVVDELHLGGASARRVGRIKLDHVPAARGVPYLLIAKKRYVGLVYESPNCEPKVDVKGFELVRRDVCAFTKAITRDVVHKILYERNVAGAMQVAREHVDRAADGQVPLQDYILSKSLKREEDYANPNLPQLAVVRQMRRRKEDAPRSGDRVPFVVIRTRDPSARIFEKVEHPDHVREHNIPVDVEYYITNQVAKPIRTLIEGAAPATDVAKIFEHALAQLKRQRMGIKRGILDVFTPSNGASGEQLPSAQSQQPVSIFKVLDGVPLDGAPPRTTRRRPNKKKVAHDAIIPTLPDGF